MLGNSFNLLQFFYKYIKWLFPHLFLQTIETNNCKRTLFIIQLIKKIYCITIRYI